MKKKTGNKINRRYKDRLFYALFGSEERKRLTLELYNAINQTDYDNPDDLQLNTIEDVVYMGMKNDVSFLLASDRANITYRRTPSFFFRGFCGCL